MFDTIYGVDFSGAKLAGRNIWVARLERPKRPSRAVRHRLVELASLERLCGTAERGPALGHLVQLIADSRAALWALCMGAGLPE